MYIHNNNTLKLDRSSHPRSGRKAIYHLIPVDNSDVPRNSILINSNLGFSCLPLLPCQVNSNPSADTTTSNGSVWPCCGKSREESDGDRSRKCWDIWCLKKRILRVAMRHCYIDTNIQKRTINAAGYAKLASIWKIGFGSMGLYSEYKLGPKFRWIQY